MGANIFESINAVKGFVRNFHLHFEKLWKYIQVALCYVVPTIKIQQKQTTFAVYDNNITIVVCGCV